MCRSVDAALRRSIPAFNKDVKDVQNRMEAIAFQLRIPQRKPWQGMTDNVASSLALIQQQDKVCLPCLCCLVLQSSIIALSDCKSLSWFVECCCACLSPPQQNMTVHHARVLPVSKCCWCQPFEVVNSQVQKVMMCICKLHSCSYRSGQSYVHCGLAASLNTKQEMQLHLSSLIRIKASA